MDDRLMLGPLEDVAHDPYITDVAVTCDGRVWVDRGNGMDEFHPHAAFRSPQTVRDYAVQLCAQLGRRAGTMPVRSPMPRPPAAYACMR